MEKLGLPQQRRFVSWTFGSLHNCLLNLLEKILPPSSGKFLPVPQANTPQCEHETVTCLVLSTQRAIFLFHILVKFISGVSTAFKTNLFYMQVITHFPSWAQCTVYERYNKAVCVCMCVRAMNCPHNRTILYKNKWQCTSVCLLFIPKTVEIGSNVMKRTEYFVSL
jgi:hypothetical protein